MVFFRSIAQIIEDYARLYSRNSPHRINLHNLGHVLAEIENHGDVAALSGERSAAATAEDGRAKFTGKRDCRNNIVDIVRKNHSDGDLAVVGPVGCVESAAPVVEADFPTHVMG